MDLKIEMESLLLLSRERKLRESKDWLITEQPAMAAGLASSSLRVCVCMCVCACQVARVGRHPPPSSIPQAWPPSFFDAAQIEVALWRAV